MLMAPMASSTWFYTVQLMLLSCQMKFFFFSVIEINIFCLVIISLIQNKNSTSITQVSKHCTSFRLFQSDNILPSSLPLFCFNISKRTPILYFSLSSSYNIYSNKIKYLFCNNRKEKQPLLWTSSSSRFCKTFKLRELKLCLV